MSGNAKEIQVTMEECKVMIERGEALERLLQNPDFELVFMDGYQRRESHRLAILTGDPTQQTQEKQAAILAELRAIGFFNSHMRTVRTAAYTAEQTLKEHQELEAELLREEAEAN